MTDPLQYGALGLLALVVVGLGGGAWKLVIPLWKDSIETNRELRDLVGALRAATASQGQLLTQISGYLIELSRRLEELERDHAKGPLHEIFEMVNDLHRERFGSQRKSALPPPSSPKPPLPRR